MYEMDFAHIGANIQRELDGKSMTQQSLADALSISEQTLNKILKGAKAINTIELTQIASVLGTTTDALLMTNNHTDEPEHLSFIERITDERTREKAELIQSAIDEIRFLEELTQSLDEFIWNEETRIRINNQIHRLTKHKIKIRDTNDALT